MKKEEKRKMLKKLLLVSSFALGLILNGADSILPVYFKQDPGIVVDGNLTKEDWDDIGSVILLDSRHGNRKVANALYQWKSDADLSAAVKLAYRMDGFSIGCRIRDDIHHQKRIGADCWRGDHVELLLDFRPLSDPERTKFGKNQFHIVLSPGSLDGKIKPEAFMLWPEKRPLKIAIAAVKTKNGYQLEAEVPWSVFGFHGQKYPQRQLIGVDVMISDTDRKGDAQEKYLFAGKLPFARKRGRLLMAYLSDPRGHIPVDLKTSGKTILTKDPVRMDEENSKYRIEFDYQPESGLAPIIGFTAFGCTAKTYAGHSNLLKVSVNGQLLKGDRLFNKSNKVVLKNGKPFLFVNALGEINLPYIKSAKNHPGAKANWYVFRDPQDWLNFEFDLNGLLKPGKNIIVFDNEFQKRTPKCRPVEVSGVTYFQSSLKTKNKRPAPSGAIPVITPAPVGKVSFELKKLSESAFEIMLNGDIYRINSRWTIPEGRFVTGENPYFIRKREMLRKDELVVVRDTLTNRTDKDLPVMHFHEVLAAPETEFYLNGFSVSKSMLNFQHEVNGSTYVKGTKSGLGLFPLSDMMRAHGENYIESKTVAGLADRKMVIPAGKSLTYEFAVIPTSMADYYAFINALRRELKVNFKINGSLCHADDWWVALHCWLYEKDRAKSVEALRKYITYTSSYYTWIYGTFMGAHPNVMGHGSRKEHPSFYTELNRKNYLKLLSLVLEAVPDVHTAVYYHCFIDTWRESMMLFKADATINSYGQHQHYYARPASSKTVSMLYVPTLTNGFGKACSKQIGDILKYHCPPNAYFYWDEFRYAKTPYSYNPNIWDGCSGEIDPKTYQLKRRMTSVCLASAEFRLAMVRKIKASGREIMVNSMPLIRSIMDEHLMAFTETAQISNCARGHVYTPIQLGNHLIGQDAERPEVIYQQMLDGLDFGMLYYYYHIRYIPDHYTLTQYMFPITPMELHKGYIIGKEKIITKVSGLYGWNDASWLTAHVYDDKGWPVPGFKAPVVKKDGKNFIELRLPEDWSAVIIRK